MYAIESILRVFVVRIWLAINGTMVMLLGITWIVGPIDFTGMLPYNLYIFNAPTYDLVYLFCFITSLVYKARFLCCFGMPSKLSVLGGFRPLLV